MEQVKDPWELEHEEERPPKLEFTPKAHLWLQGSGQYEWGVVKDCHGRINMVSPDDKDVEVVGMWNRYAEGDIWVDLTISLEALRDRAVQLYKELSESRTAAMAQLGIQVSVKRVPRTLRAKAEPKAEQPRDEKISKLRSLFTTK